MADPTKELDPRYFPLILDVLDQGVFTVDGNLCINSFNQVAERITGYAADDVIGTRCSDVFRTNICGEVCPLRLSIASRRPTRNREIHIKTRDGRPVPISVSTAPLLTRGGRLLGGVEVFRDLTQIEDLRRRVDGQYRLADIIGKSAAMRRIFDLLPLIAPSDSTVLVTGPSGTGKELIARTIHALGPRRKNPFVALNCAAIPETLLESELFGYKRGAFTDARKDKPGRIAAAENGTLFLDEIGDLPRLTQVKLLRFLQDRIYEPLGSNTSVRANVHVIAATNRDLLQLVRAGNFREDLYFRLNVVQIEVPPLSWSTTTSDCSANPRGRPSRASRTRPWPRSCPIPSRGTSASWRTSSNAPSSSARATASASSTCPRRSFRARPRSRSRSASPPSPTRSSWP
jgi:PAS domain S-box-containing protein